MTSNTLNFDTAGFAQGKLELQCYKLLENLFFGKISSKLLKESHHYAEVGSYFLSDDDQFLVALQQLLDKADRISQDLNLVGSDKAEEKKIVQKYLEHFRQLEYSDREIYSDPAHIKASDDALEVIDSMALLVERMEPL